MRIYARCIFIILITILISTCFCVALSANRIIYINSSTGSDNNDGLSWSSAKKTITSGIGIANAGDQVWVAKGNYIECTTINKEVELYGGFHGDEVTLYDRLNFPRTIPDSNETVVDGSNNGSALTISAGLTNATRIDGFTITKVNTMNNAGIYCSGSSPTITNNIITNNSSFAGYTKAGICCVNSSAVITKNIFSNNATSSGCIYCSDSSPKIFQNIIRDNACIGIYYTGSSTPIIANNVITGNCGVGIYCDSMYSNKIINNTIISNAGGGIWSNNMGDPIISNNIIAYNLWGIEGKGGGVLDHNCLYNPEGYNYFEIVAGTKDILLDPKIEAKEYGKYHIQSDSPCIDAGSDTVIQSNWTDIDGQFRIQGAHADIGADESDGTKWTYNLTIIRVSSSGNDQNDGSSWDHAKKSIQSAIDAAAVLGGGEVWVAAGSSYIERISLKPYVYVYGGFSGKESLRSERDWVKNKTIIDGSGGECVVSTFASGYLLSSIDGFTIRNAANQSELNGAVNCTSSPLICNNTISDNRCNGIFCGSGVPKIYGNTISDNAGIVVYLCTTGKVLNNIINNNGSYGIDVCSSSIISGNTITNNRNSGIYSYGSSADISENIISSNAALNYGGGIYSLGGSTLSIRCNVIQLNSARYGGGISCDNTESIINNTIINNTATIDGGGIYICNFNLINGFALTNNIIAFNSSGIYKSTNSVADLTKNCVYNPNGYNYSWQSSSSTDINTDPLFICDSYHLSEDSPCIEAGYNKATTTPDIDGDPRLMGYTIDIGADEYIPTEGFYYLKTAKIGKPVRLNSVVVTSVFNYIIFYVENDNRTFGTLVSLQRHNLTVGTRININGSISIQSTGERYLKASSVSIVGNGNIEPLFMNNSSLGGVDFSPCIPDVVSQRGVIHGKGPNNIGLLIRIAGVYNYLSSNTFTVDDGSGFKVKCIVPSTITISPDWKYVTLTGLSSCQMINGVIDRLVFVRDITPIQ